MASTEHDQRDVEAAKAACSKVYGSLNFDDATKLDAYAIHAAKVARLMAEGKWPEVDPDLVEARECAALQAEASGNHAVADAYRSGERDNWIGVPVALLAIKRQKSKAPASDREG